ncbi:MAG TPA: ATP-binding protein [Gammaproteobacteria bacterium]|nr:ATP-binding protein [Gammaproteobacteria bacterium]
MNTGVSDIVDDKTFNKVGVPSTRRRDVDVTGDRDENETLLYSITHDLRSPLVNLHGFSQELLMISEDMRALLGQADCPAQIQKRGLELLDGDMKNAINFIQASAARLTGIMDALLRLSRAGRATYQPQDVDLNPIIQRIVDSMNSIITQRAATVTRQQLPLAWGDPAALEQIFTNLVGNALNYLEPGRPGVIEIGCLSEWKNNMPVFYVKDNGLGMTEQARSKLFRVFQRFHPDVAKGEGIGLALVKRMVERHGGTIWVESMQGAGTTFFVELPNEQK